VLLNSAIANPLIAVLGAIGIVLVFLFEWVYLARNPISDGD
jgi:hypothetical protein